MTEIATLPALGRTDHAVPGVPPATVRTVLGGRLRLLRRIALPLGGVVLALAWAAVAFWPTVPALMAGAAAAGLATALAAALLASPAPRRAQALADALARQLANDPDALLVTDPAGTPLRTPAPGTAPGTEAGLEAALDGWCAEPRRVLATVLAELRETGGTVREFRRGGAGLRLTAQAIGPDGPGSEAEGVVLWRLARVERMGQRSVGALGLPVLTLGPDGAPLAANPALVRLIDLPEGDDGLDPRRLAQALAPVLARLGPALAAGSARLAFDLPGGQAAEGVLVPARDGQQDLLVFPGGGGAPEPLRLGPQDYEDIPVALVQIDAEGRIRGTNRAARSLLGLAAAEDRFLWEVVEGLGRPVADWLRDARAGRALNRPEVLRATCAGAETFVQIILRRAASPAPAGALVAVVSDATELKSLEARFVQSQKMQAIGQLAGGIAHDFNNLLTAITGHCDLLLLGRDAFDPDHDDLQQIQQNANRAAALVRQLLAFSRKQTLQPEVVAVEALLEDVVLLLTRLVGERISLRLNHDPAVRPIRADRRQLEQVIVNLVVNARDAMPMGGEIRIETEALVLAAERSIGRAHLPAGSYSVIRVIDTGVGIPADILDKIFEPFFTTKRPGEGTGLGLSTAYGIVKQMGGFIFADSREGSGATFSLYFAADTSGVLPAPSGAPPAAMAQPVRRAEAAQAAAPARRPARPAPPVPAPADPGATVLLVEDEAPVRAFAARALRLQGYQVLEAEDGEHALEVVNDPRAPVDIIVTDVIMPGLDGPSWVAQALLARPGTPVVFVSGYIEDTLTEALGRTPNAVFLEKPFSLEALTRTLAAQLATGRAWPPPRP
jgi:two-component system cell cycle sensor histidine kinase/response regulator CckA